MNFDTRVFQKDVQNSDGKPQLPTDLVIQDQSPIDPLVSQIKFCLRTWALDPKSILPINYSLLSHVVLVVRGMRWVMQGPALGLPVALGRRGRIPHVPVCGPVAQNCVALSAGNKASAFKKKKKKPEQRLGGRRGKLK